jgi:hypothetical protein
MAVRQAYRGNPAEKQYQITQNFIGGLNTKEADDVVTDIEFRELLNVDLGNQGIITNRKGFKDLVVFNEMMEAAVDENGDPTAFPTSVFRLAKVVTDPENIIPLLSKFESLAAFRTSVQSKSYKMVFLFLINYDYYSLTIEKPADQLIETVVFKKLYEGIPVEFDLADVSIQTLSGDTFYSFSGGSTGTYTLTLPTPPAGTVVKNLKIVEIRYQPNGLSPMIDPPIKTFFGNLTLNTQNQTTNEFDLLYFIDEPLSNDLRPDDPQPQVFLFTEEVASFEEINIDLSYLDGLEITFQHIVTYGPGGFSAPAEFWVDFEVTYGPDFDANAEVLKTYRSRISENNVEFLDSVYILPEFEAKIFEYDINQDSVSEVDAYKPTPFDIKFVGFNVLADNPLTYIEDQGISNKNIEGVFLTRDGNKPIRAIDGGKFELNVIHTGTTFKTDEVGIDFFINYLTDDQQQIFPSLVKARDEGGLFIFEYNSVGLSGFVGREITILVYELDKSEGSNLTQNVDFSSGVPVSPPVVPEQFETTLKVQSSSPFQVNQNYILAQPGIYESVRIKQIVDSTTIIIFGRVNNTYLVSNNARLFKAKEKTTNKTFDNFLDSYQIINTLFELPQAVEKLDLTGYKILEIDYRLVFYGGKTIWFSDLYQFNYLPNYNFIVLPLGTTDQIQRIVFFRGSYIIFTKDEIYRMSGSFGSSNFRIDSVNKFVGCIAPNTVRNVGNELFFLTRDGLYKLKSSIFQDNLENVEKIDKAIADDVPISEFVDSLLYDEQYILYYNEGEQYDTLRMYYDIDLGRSRNPFVRDIFAQKPELLVSEDGRIFAVKNNRWYIYDEGYTDFMSNGVEDSEPYTYNCRIETPSISLGFPTHQKKFKNVFIKALHGDKITPLFITIKVDGYDVLTPNNSFPFINELSEVEYITTTAPNITLQSSAFLGDLQIGATPLGEITQRLHKLSFGGKGKNIKVIIEQKLDSSFGILSIGYLHKLGKVKE